MKLSATFYALEGENYASHVIKDRYPTAMAARKAAREGKWLSDQNYVSGVTRKPTLTVKQITVQTSDLDALNAFVTGTGWNRDKLTKSEKSLGVVDVSHLAQAARALAT